jgi:eukaryotic-like serine/threonine-protein kinase
VELTVNPFKPGDTFYYFEIVRVLGAGLHGAVYEIRHQQTGDAFALKTMYAADCVDPRKTARALAGARGNYRIQHKNVVEVLDLNCEDDGLVWMRTELLRGYTIHELLARQGRLSLPFALAVAIRAAFGLHAVHEAQIIHRDIKPSNLFYTEGREVKVLDLSLAKVLPEGLETTAGKRIGLGTPAYAAPEQLEGHGTPDVRADVHCLGITLWEMLAGTNPYADVLDDHEELLRRQITVMPAPLAEVARLPREVDAVVRRAVAKDPADRYSSAMEMARALMDLDAWIAAEARARRLRIVVPLGEPPLPGDANTWRDYRAPEPTPPHTSPPAAPAARVIVAGPVAARPPAALVATEPLLPAAPPGGLGGTLPLDEVALTRRAPALPFVPAPVAAPAPAPSPSLHETLDATARSKPGELVAAQPRRGRWPAVLLAAALASLGSAALVLSHPGSTPAPAAPGSATTTLAPPPPPLAPVATTEPAPTASAFAPTAARAQPSASPSAAKRASAPAKQPPPPPASASPAALPAAPATALSAAPATAPAETHRAPFQSQE